MYLNGVSTILDSSKNPQEIDSVNAFYLRTQVGSSFGAQKPSAWQQRSALPTSSKPCPHCTVARQPKVWQSAVTHPCGTSPGSPQERAGAKKSRILRLCGTWVIKAEIEITNCKKILMELEIESWSKPNSDYIEYTRF